MKSKLAGILVATLVLSGVFGCWFSGDSPERAARSYFEALASRDYDKFIDALAPDQRGSLAAAGVWVARRLAGDIPLRDVKSQVVERNTDSGRVRITGKTRVLDIEGYLDVVVRVVKLDGKWYVAEPLGLELPK